MNVTVRCFAMVRELLGQDRLEVELPDGASVEDLLRKLADDSPELPRLPLAFAVNQAYAKSDHVLAEGDEVALIPPISGGEPVFTFSRETLDPRSLESSVRSDHDGAIVTFAGVTRDHNEGDRVRGLSYEAYEEMAVRVVEAIVADARQQFEIGAVRVAHRLGDVPIGEASILVVVASAHRGPAFDACRFVMDRIKREAPIFKREWLEGDDGQSRWVGELPEH